MAWLAQMVVVVSLLLMLAGLALILDASLHSLRSLRAEIRSHRR